MRRSVIGAIIALAALASSVFSQVSTTSSEGAVTVVIVPCAGEVDETMARSVKKGIYRAKTYPRAVLVLEMDTFGGKLAPAYDISDMLSAADGLTTVAFVKTKAISAGALIALSCKKFFMRPNTTIGDCAPILVSLIGSEMLGEKVQSPLRAKFRALAQLNRFPSRLAEAMVSRGPELYGFSSSQGLLYCDSVEYAALPDSVKNSLAGKRLVLKRDQLLTLTDGEAATYGFTSPAVRDIDEIMSRLSIKEYGFATETKSEGSLSRAWSGLSGGEKFFWYLAIPFTILLLLLLGMTFMGLVGTEFGDHVGDAPGDTDHQAGDTHGASHFFAAFKLFTVRNFVVFFSMFGWTGIAMRRSGAGGTLSFVVALLAGLAMMVVVSFLFYLVSRLSSSGTVDITAAAGATGTVYVPIPQQATGFGKVNVSIQGRIHELGAKTDGPRIETGARVRIVKVLENNLLIVEKM
jgi:membrane-bound ClpP family serine protease